VNRLKTKRLQQLKAIKEKHNGLNQLLLNKNSQNQARLKKKSLWIKASILISNLSRRLNPPSLGKAASLPKARRVRSQERSKRPSCHR